MYLPNNLLNPRSKRRELKTLNFGPKPNQRSLLVPLQASVKVEPVTDTSTLSPMGVAELQPEPKNGDTTEKVRKKKKKKSKSRSRRGRKSSNCDKEGRTRSPSHKSRKEGRRRSPSPRSKESREERSSKRKEDRKEGRNRSPSLRRKDKRPIEERSEEKESVPESNPPASSPRKPPEPGYPPPGIHRHQGRGWRGVIPYSDHPRWKTSKNKAIVKRAKQELFDRQRDRRGWS